jgi:hypothetical protein
VEDTETPACAVGRKRLSEHMDMSKGMMVPHDQSKESVLKSDSKIEKSNGLTF